MSGNKNNQAHVHWQLELQNQLLRSKFARLKREGEIQRNCSCSSELGREEGRSLEFNALLS